MHGKDAKIPFLRNSFFNSNPIPANLFYLSIQLSIPFPSYIHAGNTSPHVFFRFLPSSVSCFLKDTFFPSHQPALPDTSAAHNILQVQKDHPAYLPTVPCNSQHLYRHRDVLLPLIPVQTTAGLPIYIVRIVKSSVFHIIFEYLPFRSKMILLKFHLFNQIITFFCIFFIIHTSQDMKPDMFHS